MPIYEYECRSCGEAFELLVLGSDAPKCPACASSEVERQMSLPMVSSDGTRSRNLQDARKQGMGVQKEKAVAEQEARRHHIEEH